MLLCFVWLLSALPFSVGAESEKLQLTQWQAQTEVAYWVGVTSSSVSPEEGGNSLKITAPKYQFVYTAVQLKATPIIGLIFIQGHYANRLGSLLHAKIRHEK